MERFSLNQCILWLVNDLISINFKLKIGDREYFHIISEIWSLISVIINQAEISLYYSVK